MQIWLQHVDALLDDEKTLDVRQELVKIILELELVGPLSVEHDSRGEDAERLLQFGDVRGVVGGVRFYQLSGETFQHLRLDARQTVYGGAGGRNRVGRDLHFDDEHQQQLGQRQQRRDVGTVGAEPAQLGRQPDDGVAAQRGHVARHGRQTHPQRVYYRVKVLYRQCPIRYL